ncbi:EAL domain-containing protein [Patescibacteria group bacterium]|nr:EAL domain-containing protein [Patescibacteria group bacterium]
MSEVRVSKVSSELKTIATMNLVLFLVTTIIIAIFYNIAFRQQEHLLEIVVNSHIRIIKNTGIEKLLSVVESHSELGEYENIELQMALKRGNKTRFFFHHNHDEHFEAGIAESFYHGEPIIMPMRNALKKQSGVVISSDNRIEELVAFGFVDINSDVVGIVAKMNMSEIRSPFLWAAIASLIFMLLVSYLFSRVNLLPLFKFKEIAYRDALTGISNREAFFDQLKQVISAAKRHNFKFAVFVIDLDRFKWVNDNLGHDAGDALLKEFVKRVNSVLRQEDLLARIGGDEFTIIVYVDNHEQAKAIAQKIMEVMAPEFVFNENQMQIKLSIGISFYPINGNDATELLKNADIAMYQAKGNGKSEQHSSPQGVYRCFNVSMTAAEIRSAYVRSILSKAIENRSILVHYQPQVDVSGEIVSCEALMRLIDPNTGGYISPVEFIAVAESSSLIISLGNLVVQIVCAQIKVWENMKIEIKVSLNVSGKEFENPTFVNNLFMEIARSEINPNILVLEFTESYLITPVIAQRMMRLADLGTELHLDDFGTQNSNLIAVKSGIFTAIKIDRYFVKDVVEEGISFVSSVINLVHNLGLSVIIEGIETCEQISLLKPLVGNGDLFQGFFCAPAVTSMELEKLLEHQTTKGSLECWLKPEK